MIGASRVLTPDYGDTSSVSVDSKLDTNPITRLSEMGTDCGLSDVLHKRGRIAKLLKLVQRRKLMIASKHFMDCTKRSVIKHWKDIVLKQRRLRHPNDDIENSGPLNGENLEYGTTPKTSIVDDEPDLVKADALCESSLCEKTPNINDNCAYLKVPDLSDDRCACIGKENFEQVYSQVADEVSVADNRQESYQRLHKMRLGFDSMRTFAVYKRRKKNGTVIALKHWSLKLQYRTFLMFRDIVRSRRNYRSALAQVLKMLERKIKQNILSRLMEFSRKAKEAVQLEDQSAAFFHWNLKTRVFRKWRHQVLHRRAKVAVLREIIDRCRCRVLHQGFRHWVNQFRLQMFIQTSNAKLQRRYFERLQIYYLYKKRKRKLEIDASTFRDRRLVTWAFKNLKPSEITGNLKRNSTIEKAPDGLSISVEEYGTGIQYKRVSSFAEYVESPGEDTETVLEMDKSSPGTLRKLSLPYSSDAVCWRRFAFKAWAKHRRLSLWEIVRAAIVNYRKQADQDFSASNIRERLLCITVSDSDTDSTMSTSLPVNPSNRTPIPDLEFSLSAKLKHFRELRRQVWADKKDICNIKDEIAAMEHMGISLNSNAFERYVKRINDIKARKIQLKKERKQALALVRLAVSTID